MFMPIFKKPRKLKLRSSSEGFVDDVLRKCQIKIEGTSLYLVDYDKREVMVEVDHSINNTAFVNDRILWTPLQEKYYLSHRATKRLMYDKIRSRTGIETNPVRNMKRIDYKWIKIANNERL